MTKSEHLIWKRACKQVSQLQQRIVVLESERGQFELLFADAKQRADQLQQDKVNAARFAHDKIMKLLARVEGLEQALRKVLESAHPNEKEHPAMFRAWNEARAALQPADRAADASKTKFTSAPRWHKP